MHAVNVINVRDAFYSCYIVISVNCKPNIVQLLHQRFLTFYNVLDPYFLFKFRTFSSLYIYIYIYAIYNTE